MGNQYYYFILLIISVVIFKYILRDHKQQHSGYDTYTVKAETPIQIEGKAAPQSVKLINIIVKLVR